ncbi:DNA circularization N-terminal domain-containing protein [Aliivibrio salmonicida]|uniref:DNA circularization N-terminal domain-containing protein n=1 Tax=Aliivibrio salmonicida TaxID=40269 RepID=UPI00406C6666
MWERKYEQGRWNGLVLNILSTAIDGGKRLHISEIPYADLPTIKVMGSAASNLSIDVVLVGRNSLVDANVLLANLDKTPKGELEHPWLGELPLVFETYSQKIDTKLGLVTLSLSFVRGGELPALSSIVTSGAMFDVSVQSDEVIAVSSTTFAADVDAASISDIETLRTRFTGLVTNLQGVASRLSIPSQTLSLLNQELNSALIAVSSIANAPMQFAEQLSKTVKSVAKAVRSENKVASVSINSSSQLASEAVDNSRMAQTSMLELIDLSAPSAHLNVQIVVAAVLMSKDIAELTQRDSFDVVQSSTQPLFILNDLKRITTEMEVRIGDATRVSTLESLELFNALVVLKDGINTQIGKVIKGSVPTRHKTLPRPVPALALSYQYYSNAELVAALNPTQHPLFLRDVVAIEVAS